jgi:hypothetical protein
VDSKYVYWADNVNPGAILYVPIGGGSVMTLAPLQNTPDRVVVDSDSVYWTNDVSSTGTVMRVAKP